MHQINESDSADKNTEHVLDAHINMSSQSVERVAVLDATGACQSMSGSARRSVSKQTREIVAMETNKKDGPNWDEADQAVFVKHLTNGRVQTPEAR